MAMINQTRLKEVLSYDADTGVFHWIKKPASRANRVCVGEIAGCQDTAHGVLIGIDKKIYGAHRLAWLYVHGYLPDEIDHKNGNPSDNRLANLRACNHADNLKNIKKRYNNTSGYKGVSFHRETGRWRARIAVAQKSISLGLHDTKEQAEVAYRDAAIRYHGEFARFE